MKIKNKLMYSLILVLFAAMMPLVPSAAGAEKSGPPPKAKGKVRVVTTCVKIRHQSLAENLADWLKVVDKAGALKPDVILLSETVYERGVGLSGESITEKVPGTLTNAMAKKAVKYKSYIVFSLFERVDEKTIYNTAVLIDRKGKIVGKYHKIHVPDEEIAMGEIPGKEYPVFKTDFGTVGLEVCWDLVMPEIAQNLAEKGAKLILAPSIGDFWPDNAYVGTAKFNNVFLAVSGQDVAAPGDKPSVIVDPDGKVLAAVTDPSTVEPYQPGWGSVAYADIDMKKANG